MLIQVINIDLSLSHTHTHTHISFTLLRWWGANTIVRNYHHTYSCRDLSQHPTLNISWSTLGNILSYLWKQSDLCSLINNKQVQLKCNWGFWHVSGTQQIENPIIHFWVVCHQVSVIEWILVLHNKWLMWPDKAGAWVRPRFIDHNGSTPTLKWYIYLSNITFWSFQVPCETQPLKVKTKTFEKMKLQNLFPFYAVCVLFFCFSKSLERKTDRGEKALSSSSLSLARVSAENELFCRRRGWWRSGAHLSPR